MGNYSFGKLFLNASQSGFDKKIRWIKSKINNNNSEKLKEKIDNISLKIDKLIKIKNSI